MELKSYKMIDEKYCTDCVCVIPSEVYDKSEADEVIAELKAQKAQTEDDCAYWKAKAQRERYSNYKRCLAMANWCEEVDLFGGYTLNYWMRWRNKWLELAETYRE